MILAVSRFRIVSGHEESVRAAFLARPRLVDSEPGFLGIETFTDSEDPSTFHLVTRWSDVASFKRWHKSEAHNASHKFIPKGLKLDPAFTTVIVLDRVDSNPVPENVTLDRSPFICSYLLGSRCVLYLAADKAGTVLFANRAVEDCPSFKPTAVGASIWSALTDSAAEELRAAIGRGQRQPKQDVILNFKGWESYECRIDVQPDGFVLIGDPLHQEGISLQDRLFEVNNQLATVGRELARKNRELAQSESRYRHLAASVPGIVFTTSPDGYTEYISPQWYSYTGADSNSGLGVEWLDWVHPEDRIDVWQKWQASIRSARRFDVEFRLRDAHGNYRWFLTRCVPPPDETIQNWSGACIDIHERKLVRERLEQTAAELVERSEELTRSNQDLQHFTYAVSHDLQEPLRSITAFMQLLSRKYENQLEDQAKEYIREATSGAQRMATLLRDLLTYSHVARERGAPPERVDLNVALHWATMNLAESVREQAAVIESDRLPTIRGDASQLIQVFQNLIGNAIKYRSDEAPRIEIRVRGEDGHWTVTVRDNGAGFRQEYADQIFGIFKRLHGREVPGSGVGLSIVKRIIERHGGSIRAESEPGKGAAFIITLPVDED